MAQTKEYVIQLSVQGDGAIKNIDAVEKSLEQSAKSANSVKSELRAIQKELANLPQGSKEFDALSRKAGQLKDQINDASEAIRANAGNSIETLSNNVGNLGNRFATLDFEGLTQDFKGIAGSVGNIKFSDLTNGLKTAAAGFADLGKVILTNPIFLIGAAIAAVVLNFDKLKEVIDLGVNPATRKLAEETRAAAEASKEAFDAFGLEERRLRALGVAEDEIAEKRKQATKERLAAIKVARQAEAKLLQEQVAEFEKTGGQGLGLFGPSLDDIKESTARLAQLRKEEEEFSVQVLEIDKRITDGQKAENEKRNAENQKAADSNRLALEQRAKQERELLELQRANAQKVFEINNQVREKIQALEDKSVDDQLTKLKSKDDEAFKQLETQEQLRLQLLADGQEKEIQLVDQKYIKLREQAFGNAELEKQLAEANGKEVDDIKAKYDKQDVQRQQQLNQTKLQLASDSIGALTTLVTSFNAKNEQQAKKQFAITKALNIAQALVNTYSAVTGALTAGGNPLKLATGQQFVEAGIAASVGLAQVAKIASTKYGSGSGGGGNVSTSSGGGFGGGASGFGGNGGAPTFNPVNTQFLNNRPPQATPAYVLSGAVTDAQVADQKIKEQARL